jgi:hypothetical protein
VTRSIERATRGVGVGSDVRVGVGVKVDVGVAVGIGVGAVVKVGMGVQVGGTSVNVAARIGEILGAVALGIGIAGVDAHATVKDINRTENVNLDIVPPFQFMVWEHAAPRFSNCQKPRERFQRRPNPAGLL